MFVVGSARNITGMLLGDDPKPYATVEVVLVCHKPFYGLQDNKLVKGQEIDQLRFNVSPTGLRALAKNFVAFADEAEKAFGTEEDHDDPAPEPGNTATTLPDAQADVDSTVQVS